MPELPEVETVRRDLRAVVIGRHLLGVWCGPQPLRRPWQSCWADQVVGARIVEIRRRGKWLIVDLSTTGRLLVHLGMTGQLTVAPTTSPRLEHTHLVFPLDGAAEELRFRDIRRFGSVTWFASEQGLDGFLSQRLGPEPFDWTPAGWQNALSGTERCLKAVLLDQQVIAGVGNIYADEALFQAQLHPEMRASSLTVLQAERLLQALVRVLRRAIDCRGSTIRNYIGGSGLQGGYQAEFCVYGQAGAPCPRCRTSAIAMVRLAGRSSHYCPRCQPSA